MQTHRQFFAPLAHSSTTRQTYPPMNRHFQTTILPLLILCSWFASQAKAEEVRIATYNIENWQYRFDADKLEKRAATQPSWPQEFLDLIAREKRENFKDNWGAQLVLEDPAVNADVLVIQEGPELADLEYFNRTFLNKMYETIHVFATNTGRIQNTAIFLKPGFSVVEIREAYHLEPDKDDVNPLTDLLFARGPAFVRIKSPGGKEFWVGTNHFKSKSGNSVEVTKWRNAESKRANEIIKEIASTSGVADVVFLGDINDELGNQEFELEAGGSGADLLGEGLVTLTKPLVDKGEISFGGYRSTRFRSFIDHVYATPSAAAKVKSVSVVTTPFARINSDHYPVVAVFNFE